MNNKDNDSRHHDTAFTDPAVQEKDVTCPTDAKSHKKIVKKALGTVRKTGPSHASKLRLCIEGDLSWPAFPGLSEEQGKSP